MLFCIDVTDLIWLQVEIALTSCHRPYMASSRDRSDRAYSMIWLDFRQYIELKLNTTLCSDLHPAQCGQSESFFFLNAQMLPCSYGKWKGRVHFQGFLPRVVFFYFDRKKDPPGNKKQTIFFFGLIHGRKKYEIHSSPIATQPKQVHKQNGK